MFFHRHCRGSRRVTVVGLLMCSGLLFVALPAAAVGPDTPKGARELLTTRLQAAAPGSPEWKVLMADGQARTEFCAHCHGGDGMSVMALVPNLAGQSPYYLLEQIEKFADGRRHDYIMTPLARQFSEQDMVAVAFYYSNMKPRSQAADAGLAEQGATLFGQRCTGCHGQDAHGGHQYARLAGQNSAYLRRRLAGFREDSGSSVTVMTSMAKSLSEKDIEAVTAYLSTLP